MRSTKISWWTSSAGNSARAFSSAETWRVFVVLEFGRLVWFLGLGVRFLDIGFSAKNPMWPQSVPVLLLPRDSLWASLSFPFMIFQLPVLSGILTHTIPTGYNAQGLCVPYLLRPMPENELVSH